MASLAASGRFQISAMVILALTSFLYTTLYIQQSRQIENMSRELSQLEQQVQRLADLEQTYPHQRGRRCQQQEEEEGPPYILGHSEYRGFNKEPVPFDSHLRPRKHRVVPKIVHYIWLFDRDHCYMRFHNFLSILSVHQHIKPTEIIIWYTEKPCGRWWDEANYKVSYITLRKVKPPDTIFGIKMRVIEHKSDIIRINSIIKHGGIYLDFDVIALRSFDPLLYYDTTLGAENPDQLGSGIIIAAPNTTFMNLWLQSYKTFNDRKWAYHATVMPMILARNDTWKINVEWDTLHRPNWRELEWLYRSCHLWDWSVNYAVHLWYRRHGYEHNPVDIKRTNTTMGQIFRYIYYGDKNIIK